VGLPEAVERSNAFAGSPYSIIPFPQFAKVRKACHSTHLAKIQGIKSISKPRLAIEIYAFWKNISTEEFRK
jgi:hypothetical protein